MFERRLKFFLGLLAILVCILLTRAAQVQILSRQYWRSQAVEAMKHTHLVETTRGNVLDRKGRILAIDKPCIDACIDYRALMPTPDPEWVKAKALDRLKTRQGDGWAKLTNRQKAELRDQEIAAVNADIASMWGRLANASGRSTDEILETRDAIVDRVRMRQRYIWYKRYTDSLKKEGKKVETASWKKWLADGGDDTPPIDNFAVVVSEQLEAHVILQAVDSKTQNELEQDIDRFPGLLLRPGTHRTYPYDDVACHLLGHLARVGPEDLKDDNKKPDELRDYLRNDLVGKTGVESLAEPALRGTRGRIDRMAGEDAVVASQDPTPGQDVRLTIDVELQQQIQSAFAAARLRNAYGEVVEEDALLHGAAVVLDVPTNQVLALVSYPTYNLNQFDELYPQLREDEINDPLNNRATMSQLEPGSTIKPLCGLAAISEGAVGLNEGIECTGVLKLGGHVIPGGRCWVDSKFGELLRSKGMSSAHHPIPFPHVGHDGNQDGWLTYSDALERSCNVYFETSADRLGADRLSAWYERFGLGRPTGIGIGEAKGRLPRDAVSKDSGELRRVGFLGGIGQGSVAATPIQMANAVAMIARNGIWMKPVLLLPGEDGKTPLLRAGSWQDIPDRVDLHLPPALLKAAHLGMYNVVNGRAGTGKALVAGDKLLQALGICGKTGTAQAARFSIPERDASGRIELDAQHHPIRQFLDPSTPTRPNPIAPWYRAGDEDGKELNHAWYIGFAPAEHPRIAFAVMVEYGGSGGVAAASIAREALEACISRRYLPEPNIAPPASQPTNNELLH